MTNPYIYGRSPEQEIKDMVLHLAREIGASEAFREVFRHFDQMFVQWEIMGYEVDREMEHFSSQTVGVLRIDYRGTIAFLGRVEVQEHNHLPAPLVPCQERHRIQGSIAIEGTRSNRRLSDRDWLHGYGAPETVEVTTFNGRFEEFAIGYRSTPPESNNPYLQHLSRPSSRAEAQRPQPCQHCKHYHGETYLGAHGANPLVCGMHPTGPESQLCPDHELSDTSRNSV